jgi:CheY-like chemotaxis protein
LPGKDAPVPVLNGLITRGIIVPCGFRALAQLGTLPVLHGGAMKNILVIDDEDDVRAVIVATLKYAGYAVRQAGNGRDGILKVLEERPDLILCDVRMPEMDGYRTLAAIRNVPGTAAIPFILMTGSMGREEFRQAMVWGADDYLMKPFSALELIGAVESRLARQTHVRSDAYQRIEKQREFGLPHLSAQSVPARAAEAAAA